MSTQWAVTTEKEKREKDDVVLLLSNSPTNLHLLLPVEVTHFKLVLIQGFNIVHTPGS